MINDIRHIGIRVNDLNRMIEFYSHLGFRIVSHRCEDWAGRELEVCKMDAPTGDCVLELIKTHYDWPDTHFCIAVDAFPVSGIWSLGKENVRYYQDPEGNYIEMVKGDG